MDGGEWGFKAQTDLGNVSPPRHAMLSQSDRTAFLEKAGEQRDSRRRDSLQQYNGSGNRTEPAGTERYEQGWQQGYQDATTFLEGLGNQGDKIGMLEIWIMKRIKDSGYTGAHTWDFEQGLRKGISEFYSSVDL